MTLLELHADLTETNRHLARIADALERAIPLTREDQLRAHRGEHPLIGRESVSVMTPERAAEVEQHRATMATGARRDFSGAAHGAVAADEQAATSQTGQWDHDDPLDQIEEPGEERWDNYAGVDR